MKPLITETDPLAQTSFIRILDLFLWSMRMLCSP